MPTLSNNRKALFLATCLLSLCTQIGAKVKLSIILRCGKRLKCWNTMEISDLICLIFLISSLSCYGRHVDHLVFNEPLLKGARAQIYNNTKVWKKVEVLKHHGDLWSNLSNIFDIITKHSAINGNRAFLKLKANKLQGTKPCSYWIGLALGTKLISTQINSVADNSNGLQLAQCH
jgi:hypothetical protein